MSTAEVRTSSPSSSESAAEGAQDLLEGFSLPASEAKVLVAMMRFGTATPSQLAPITGIDRTNLYRLLENLQNRHLVSKSTARRSVWVAATRTEIVSRLRQREQERAAAVEAALGRLTVVLENVPQAEERAVAMVQVADDVSSAVRYSDAVAAASTEILVLNRGPYVGDLSVDPGVVAAIERGVRASALWQRHELYGPDAEGVLACAVAYAEAGVETRVVEELPLAMALIDGHSALTSLPGEAPGDTPFAANFNVESRAFAAVMAIVFDHFWQQAEPLELDLSRPPKLAPA